ncbi:MAG: hypothetical protein IKQ40_04775, partial [Lachnospiraceae bacterium]|nr:hypothetical protein [Lachnospiraceae bacterium]
MILKCTAAALIFIVISLAAGSWAVCLPGDMADRRIPLPLRFSVGGCLVILLSMLVCLAGAPFALSAQTAFGIMIAVLVFACIAGIAVERKKGIKAGPVARLHIRIADIVLIVIAVILFVIQVTVVLNFDFEQTGSLRCIPAATAVYDSGRLFMADPMMLLEGTLSYVTKIHPLIFICNMTAVPLLLLYYMCYLSVAGCLLGGRSRIFAFIVTELLCIRGYQSEWMIPATLLMSWYGIWVFIVHGLLNIAVIVIIYTAREKEAARYRSWDFEEHEETQEDIPEEWDMKKHKIINARNLAIAIALLTVALLALVFVLNSKINSLHDVTVALQEDMDKRCGLYEFAPADGQTQGYLLKESDGTLTFIGGGPKENAEALKVFLAAYGDSITNWYVYGEDEENSGAMREVISSGAV